MTVCIRVISEVNWSIIPFTSTKCIQRQYIGRWSLVYLRGVTRNVHFERCAIFMFFVGQIITRRSRIVLGAIITTLDVCSRQEFQHFAQCTSWHTILTRREPNHDKGLNMKQAYSKQASTVRKKQKEDVFSIQIYRWELVLI